MEVGWLPGHALGASSTHILSRKRDTHVPIVRLEALRIVEGCLRSPNSSRRPLPPCPREYRVPSSPETPAGCASSCSRGIGRQNVLGSPPAPHDAHLRARGDDAERRRDDMATAAMARATSAASR